MAEMFYINLKQRKPLFVPEVADISVVIYILEDTLDLFYNLKERQLNVCGKRLG